MLYVIQGGDACLFQARLRGGGGGERYKAGVYLNLNEILRGLKKG